MLIALVIALLLALGAFLFWASYSMRAQIYMPALWRISTSEPIVYLTFDDGPHPQYTPLVLDLLARHGARATFFCIGNQIAGNEDLLRRIVAEGHLIGNHSTHHRPTFPCLSTSAVVAELEACSSRLADVLGRRPRLFRPPYGVVNPNIARARRLLDLTAVGWSVRSLDTTTPQLSRTLRRIDQRLHPGAIILLHDRLPYAPELLASLLELLDQRGYRYDSLLPVAEPYSDTTPAPTPIVPHVRLAVSAVDYTSAQRRLECERHAVRQLLGQLLGSSTPADYARLDTGAPYLPEYPSLHLSISHTRGYAVVGVSEAHPIGIDIERLGDKVERVVSKFLTDEELALAYGLDNARLALHLLWSAKEAAYKLINPPSQSLCSFVCTSLALADQSHGSFTLSYLDVPDHDPITIDYAHTAGYVLCVASLRAL